MNDGILFTGITGELGSALREPLRKRGGRIYCIVRGDKPERVRDLDGFELLRSDIRDSDHLLSYAGKLKGKIGAVIHMASSRHGRSKEELRSVIYDGSINLYEFSRAVECPNFIYFSSILAAGPTPRGAGRMDENFKPIARRLCDFGRAKLMTENRLLALASRGGPGVTVLRPGNIYGRPKLSFVSFISEMLKNRNALLYERARGAVMWSPIYIEDVIDALFALLDKRERRGGVYFLTGSEHPTLGQLTEAVSAITGLPLCKPGPGLSIAASMAKTMDRLRSAFGRPSFPDYIYSNEKIRREVGFEPAVRLSEGLPITLKWAMESGIL